MSPPDIPRSGAKTGPEGSPLPEKKLVSWKEIAAHLGREVRTVQRWEKTEGLPVRRHEHQKKSTVYAYPGELDDWVKKRQPADDPEADAAFIPEPDDAPAENGNGDSVLAINGNKGAGESAPIDPDGPSGHPPPIGKRLVLALATGAILGLVAYGTYRWFQTKDSAQDRIRLVVLPFTNLSGDSKQDYVTAGLTDEIRTQLGRLDPPHLGVIAPTSSKIVSAGGRPVQEIGRTLNVKYVLEGSVQSAGNQVRIDVQLIQVSDEANLWSDSFTRDLSDVLQVESDVSAAVARQILATLPVPPPPQPTRPIRNGKVPSDSPEITKSRDAYLRGQFTWGTRGDLRSSIQFFEQAIQEDPTYAQAYAGLAAATAILGQVPNDGMPPRDAKPKAREAAQRALQLDPRLAEAHAVLGNVAMSYDWDLGTAEKELLRAIELNPNDPTAHEWYCHLLIVEGRNPEALAEVRRALDLDPVSPLFHTVLAETYYFGRSYDAAIEEAQQVVKLHPDFIFARYWLGFAFSAKKMYPEAVDTFQKARQLSGDNPAILMAYGYTQALAGNAKEARSGLQKLEQLRNTRFVPALYLAAIHVGLGESDESFRLLDLAYQERIDRLVYLGVEPMADPIRSDPRFSRLLAKVGLH
jgi:TolB-like protein/tetratricopeptide (TPR) repeat protein